jgi:hypothetical protein
MVLASPASAQPASWKAAASAALAFGHAEGKLAAFAHHPVPSGSISNQAFDALYVELADAATELTNAYVAAEHHGSPFWKAAAEVRIGDLSICHAALVARIPAPPRWLVGGTTDGYKIFMAAQVESLQRHARHSWEWVVKAELSPYWAARARERLAGGSVSGC